MNWTDWNDFLSMRGYGLYVWGSYGVIAACIAIDALIAIKRHRAARAAIAASSENTELS